MTRSVLITLSLLLGGWVRVEAADEPGEATAELKAWTATQTASLLELYRHWHAHPELSLAEQETAARLAAELQAAGGEVTTNVGGHGVVAVLKNGAGPTVLVRADMDALPVTENTGLAYASTVKVPLPGGAETGVMHACGHDMHMTCLVGVARYLASHPNRWRGTAVLVGQPAEERTAGARAMLDDGLYTRFPKPDYALALHVDAAGAAGSVACRPGYALAHVDGIDITVRGRGGHGAFPHTTIDPIVTAAQLILALQTIVSREMKPTEPAVITVGSIHGGTKSNIIPDSCLLQLTVRTYPDAARQQVLAAIERKAKGVAQASGAPEPIITVKAGPPAVYNDEQLTARVRAVFGRVLGDDRVTVAEPSMGSEDFSLYAQGGVPALMFWLGSVDPQQLARYAELGQSPPSLHSAAYCPDPEPTLRTGVTAMTSAVLELLKP